MTRRYARLIAVAVLVGAHGVSLSAQTTTESQARADSGIWVGTVSTNNPRNYSLTADIGVERWENGQKVETHFEKWRLNCTSYAPYFGTRNYCSLDRTIIRMPVPGLIDEGVVTIGKFATFNNTLLVQNADWENGRLDLVVQLLREATIQVSIDLKYVDGSVYLKDFLATSQFRSDPSDTPTAIVYRIPEYSYVLNVPMKMNGFKER